MARARTNTNEIRDGVLADLEVLRQRLLPCTDPEVEDALAGVETFIAVALRVFAKTNPSKIASEARTVELSTLI